MIDLVGIATVSITLFAVIDMIGNIPLILKLRGEHGHINSVKGSVISAVIMILTLFSGKTIFNLLGIETYHFALAGSFLIIYFGIKMVLDISDSDSSKKQASNVTIFPIVFPLISGPGTLSTIMSMRNEFGDTTIIFGILINALVIFIVLKSASWIKKLLGNMGLILIERVFGIILIAIGMKMLIYSLIMSINEVIHFI